MRVWRVCRRKHASDPLSGRGGLFASGRWHTRGRRIVYTSGSLSLAALELLVHADRAQLPADLVQIEIEIPDALGIRRVELDSLPRLWREYPAPAALQLLGDEWLSGLTTPALQVPSAVIPAEWNYLLNPEHPGAARATVVGTGEFAYDARLGS